MRTGSSGFCPAPLRRCPVKSEKMPYGVPANATGGVYKMYSFQYPVLFAHLIQQILQPEYGLVINPAALIKVPRDVRSTVRSVVVRRFFCVTQYLPNILLVCPR